MPSITEFDGLAKRVGEEVSAVFAIPRGERFGRPRFTSLIKRVSVLSFGQGHRQLGEGLTETVEDPDSVILLERLDDGTRGPVAHRRGEFLFDAMRAATAARRNLGTA